jgi:rhodanese-related sulfurtransferase
MVNQISINELAAALERGDQVIDVREAFEFHSGHIPGTAHIPMALVPLRVDELRAKGPLYLVCESGNRSWQVASYLDRHGISAVNVNGGMHAWRSAGMPVKQGA